MSTKEKNGAANEPRTGDSKETTQLSETIENAHASGDGALERDKDTILPSKERERPNDSRSPNSGNDAY